MSQSLKVNSTYLDGVLPNINCLSGDAWLLHTSGIMSDNPPNSKRPGMLAAVDLGSNSFRLLIGKIESTALGEHIRPIDTLKEPVRLAAGLAPDGYLDVEARQRGMAALARFGERLAHFEPEAVRAVATNALRVASNANAFLVPAQTALGFPIEIISGREEARMIYLGASHSLPRDQADRLVVDIGGGSTELIIGRDDEAKLVESAPIGCVSLSRQFFPDGKALEKARVAARDALAPYAEAYRRHGWQYAAGTSGTAKSLAQISDTNFGSGHITGQSMSQIAEVLAREGDVNTSKIAGLRADRRPVLPGGLALMMAVFDEFGTDSMRYCDGALREGALYDLLGRSAGHDMRQITVTQMAERYAIDHQHAEHLSTTALALFDQVAAVVDEDGLEPGERRQTLAWGCRLAEVGLAISHDSYHKPSAYVLSNADMQGFSKPEQRLLAMLALGQTGGLRKMRSIVRNRSEWLMVLCLRLASVMHRRRDDEPRPMPRLSLHKNKVVIELPAKWAAMHPLTDGTLASEVQLWQDTNAFDAISYQTV